MRVRNNFIPFQTPNIDISFLGEHILQRLKHQILIDCKKFEGTLWKY